MPLKDYSYNKNNGRGEPIKYLDLKDARKMLSQLKDGSENPLYVLIEITVILLVQLTLLSQFTLPELFKYQSDVEIHRVEAIGIDL